MNCDFQILTEIMPSETMVRYLSSEGLDPYRLKELIEDALVPLKRKPELIECVLREIEADQDAKNPQYDNEVRRDVEAALEETKDFSDGMELEPGTLLCLLQQDGLDQGEKDSSSCFLQPFRSWEQLFDYIREREAQEAEWDELYERFYWVQKWIPAADGNYTNPYNYVIVKGRVCFGTDGEHPPKEHEFNLYYSDIWVEVPFHPGDLIRFDSRPFAADVIHGVLLTVDNGSCCGVAGLTVSEDGLFCYGAVMHHHHWDIDTRMYSPVYGMEEIRADDLRPHEELLGQISDYIHEDPERGEKLFCALGEYECDYGRVKMEDMKRCLMQCGALR